MKTVSFRFINLFIVALLGPVDGLTKKRTIRVPAHVPYLAQTMCCVHYDGVPIKPPVRSINQKCSLCSTTFASSMPVVFLHPLGGFDPSLNADSQRDGTRDSPKVSAIFILGLGLCATF